jgi:pimeloyl-ACP methyl ester carboxylesterase
MNHVAARLFTVLRATACALPLLLGLADAGAVEADHLRENVDLASVVQGRHNLFRVYFPLGYELPANAGRRYPVIFFLHGKGGNYTTHVNEVMTAYDLAVTEGRLTHSIVVFLDGQLDPVKGNSFWANAADNHRKVQDDVLAAVAHIDSNATVYRTLTSSASNNYRVVMGFSMGGFGAANLAARFPEKFSAAVLIDGALQDWLQMTEGQNANTDAAANMFDWSSAAFDEYSPWVGIANNRQNIINNGVSFRSLAGFFGGGEGDRTSYAIDFHEALADIDSSNPNPIPSEFYDTAEKHQLPLLMNPTAAADRTASKLCWSFIQQAFDRVPIVGTTNDGWVLKLPTAPSTAGTLNPGGQNLMVGELGDDKVYRSILSFNTSTLPPNAVIDGATVKLFRTNGGNNQVSNLGSLYLDIKSGSFGGSALELPDWSETASADGVGTLSIPTTNGGEASATLTTGMSSINHEGVTQFRVRFNGAPSTHVLETMSFGSGDHATPGLRPRLVIQHHPSVQP